MRHGLGALMPQGMNRPDAAASAAGRSDRRRLIVTGRYTTSMGLKIRLARAGAKKRPYYHIVVADSRSPRDGRFIEKLGSYNPMLPAEHADRVRLHDERIQHWLRPGRAADRSRCALPRQCRPGADAGVSRAADQVGAEEEGAGARQGRRGGRLMPRLSDAGRAAS